MFFWGEDDGELYNSIFSKQKDQIRTIFMVGGSCYILLNELFFYWMEGVYARLVRVSSSREGEGCGRLN